MIMDEFFDQFFPTEFLIEYLENGPEENMDRFQTYVVYRFLTFAAKENPAVIKGYVRVSALYGQSL